MYIEPHHADIFQFLDAKKNVGSDEERARDLFYALWIPDLFMEKVEKNEDWFLMDPNECLNLPDVYGEEYNNLYNKYVLEGKYVRKLKARQVWDAIITSQVETGMPYMCYKDNVNRKNNQENIGIVKSSNLFVTGDTNILTSQGYFRIDKLVDREVEVWNGKMWSKTTVRRTGTFQKILDVEFSNGICVNCTPYHKFYIEDDEGKITIIDAKNLKHGMKIMKYTLPVVKINNDELNSNDYERIKYGKFDSKSILNNESLKYRLLWVKEYLFHNSVMKNDYQVGVYIQIVSKSYSDIFNLYLLLQTLGIFSFINEREDDIPNPNNFLRIYSQGILKLKELGFNEYQDFSSNNQDNYKYITIESVEECGEFADTFCFNEPLEHKGIFDGILMGNCAEIVEVSNSEEIACCNLASICLGSIVEYPYFVDESINVEWTVLNTSELRNINILFYGDLKLFSRDDCSYCALLKALLKDNNISYIEIKDNDNIYETVPQLFSEYNGETIHIGGYTNVWNILKPQVNYKKLENIAYELCVNLNNVIDKNFYPVEKTRVSNFQNRPIGIGVQGLADLFFKLKIPFESDEARDINKSIFETIYYGAMKSSNELAKKYGPYETFKGSPLSNGLFQFNLWGLKEYELSGIYDWTSLMDDIQEYGVRNSLLVALMPTASTSQIMGSTVECIEPQTSNLYTRRTLAGEFTVINPYLTKDLLDLGIWNDDTIARIIYDKGSVQKIRKLPQFLKDIYKTAYEISMKSVIMLSADRGPFVCQSQSLNLFFENPTQKLLTQSHFLGWKKGLKTGMYYCRSKPATTGQKFGIDIDKEKKFQKEDESNEEELGCLSCGA